MKMFFGLFYVLLAFSSCLFLGERVEGNGKSASETRPVGDVAKVKVTGGIEVTVEQGSTPSVIVEADENIISHLTTATKDGWLKIATQHNERLHSKSPLKVRVTVTSLNEVSIMGSGNIECKSKFSSSDKIVLSIAGSGEIKADVNAPRIEAAIKGSGTVYVMGEAKDVEVAIAGSGDYHGAELKAENATVDIAGSGSADVFADVNLTASVKGSGTVGYKGNATVKKHIAGSGEVKRM